MSENVLTKFKSVRLKLHQKFQFLKIKISTADIEIHHCRFNPSQLDIDLHGCKKSFTYMFNFPCREIHFLLERSFSVHSRDDLKYKTA